MRTQGKEYVNLYVTHEQREEVTARANEIGLSIGDYLFAVVLQALAPDEFARRLPGLVKEDGRDANG